MSKYNHYNNLVHSYKKLQQAQEEIESAFSCLAFEGDTKQLAELLEIKRELMLFKNKIYFQKKEVKEGLNPEELEQAKKEYEENFKG